jgi:hypothetical protein
MSIGTAAGNEGTVLKLQVFRTSADSTEETFALTIVRLTSFSQVRLRQLAQRF